MRGIGFSANATGEDCEAAVLRVTQELYQPLRAGKFGARTLLGWLLALLLGARTLLGAPGLTTSNKKLLSLLGARMLLGAPGLTTSNKKLLGAPGIATWSRDATRGSWPYY